VNHVYDEGVDDAEDDVYRPGMGAVSTCLEVLGTRIEIELVMYRVECDRTGVVELATNS